MRIAHIAPVATTIPPPKSGSVETMASLLTEGLECLAADIAGRQVRLKLEALDIGQVTGQ